jgi:hypothetical protein
VVNLVDWASDLTNLSVGDRHGLDRGRRDRLGQRDQLKHQVTNLTDLSISSGELGQLE